MGKTEQRRKQTRPGKKNSDWRFVREHCKVQILYPQAPDGQEEESSIENGFQNAEADPSPNAGKHKRMQTRRRKTKTLPRHMVTSLLEPKHLRK